MKEQKTAKRILSNHYDVDNRVDEAAIVYAMQSYSDQQNAELRERVKELEGAMNRIMEISITDTGRILSQSYGIAKEALKI